ncbi:MAG: hypothetical protein ACK5V3_04645 [Bdellovibrionales bacterium]
MNRFLGLISFLLLLAPFSHGVDQDFNGGSVTSTTGVTSQPASLAFIRREKRFSASVTSFDKTDFDFQGVNSIEEDRPFTMKPLYVGSAFSTQYGGWSLLIVNAPFEYRSELIADTSGVQSLTDFKILGDALAAQISTGWQIGENWGLGGALILSHAQIQFANASFVSAPTVEIFSTSETRQEFKQIQAVLGTLYVLDEFVLGMKWVSSPAVVSSQGKTRTRSTQTALPTGAPNYTDTKSNLKPEISHDHRIETGLRLGRKGFSYILSHDWQSSGMNTLRFAFEYVGGWGTISTAVSAADLDQAAQKSLTLGFIKDHDNFKWGVGPYYREAKGANTNDLSTTSWGVLYSSEIRY